MDDLTDIKNMLLGDEGVKIDVTANLAPDIYIKLFVTIVGAVLVSVIGAQLIDRAIKN